MQNIKTEEKKHNSSYLVSVGSGRLAEGKGHETDFSLVSSYVVHSLNKRTS